MKSIIAVLISIVFICSIVFAAPTTNAAVSNTANADTAIASSASVSNTDDSIRPTVAAQIKARNVSELRNMIQERQQAMVRESENKTGLIRSVYANQNIVRTAVHALLASENLTGGIGKNVSVIAREFNNSVNKTLIAEEKIQTRSWIMNALFGGDREAALEIDNETVQNAQRIQHLKDLLQNCNCSEEVRAMIHEQIQGMDAEQIRLKELARLEIANRGLLGWLWR